MPRYSWTQPCCTNCWNDRNPGRMALQVVNHEDFDPEDCVYCGQETDSGIYVRINPDEAAHPSILK